MTFSPKEEQTNQWQPEKTPCSCSLHRFSVFKDSVYKKKKGGKLSLSGFLLLSIPGDVFTFLHICSLPGYAGDFNLVKQMCQFTVGGEYLLLCGCEGASHTADGGSKRCCSPRHHLTHSQRILATVTLLLHYLRQRSTKLPSAITLFINQMADTSLDNTAHITAH